MKLTVLGCNGPYPQKDGACSGYLVETESTRVLLDCGAGVLSKLGDSVDLLDAIVLTHLHFDHMSDMLPLMYRAGKRAHRLRVFYPRQEGPLDEELSNGFDACDITQLSQLGDIRFAAVPVRHPVPAYAVRLTDANGRVLCYSGDTNTCEAVVRIAEKADLFLCDACFSTEQWTANKPHLSARLAAEAAVQAGAKRLVLTHFTPGSDVALLQREAAAVCPSVCLAYSGLCLSV